MPRQQKKATEFYKNVFGWDAQSWGGDPDYFIAQRGSEPGIDVGLRKAPDGKPLAVGIITVPKIDDPGSSGKPGAKVVVEKFAIAGEGYAAYFTDPGGLIVGVHEINENAK